MAIYNQCWINLRGHQVVVHCGRGISHDLHKSFQKSQQLLSTQQRSRDET